MMMMMMMNSIRHSVGLAADMRPYVYLKLWTPVYIAFRMVDSSDHLVPHRLNIT